MRSPFKIKKEETFAEKARRARMMRPIKGEYFEGQPEGSESTHLMSTYEGDGKYYVAPTITNKTESGEYKEQSFDEAVNAGEIFEFNTSEEADAFARGNWKLTKISDIGK